MALFLMLYYEKLTTIKDVFVKWCLLCESKFIYLIKFPINRYSSVCLSVLILIIG